MIFDTFEELVLLYDDNSVAYNSNISFDNVTPTMM